MSAHRPSFRGCCALCAMGKGKVRGQGQAERKRFSEQRKIGRRRRINRHDLGDYR